jgi:hypothetical protein
VRRRRTGERDEHPPAVPVAIIEAGHADRALSTEADGVCCQAGGMLRFTRKKLSGSYSVLTRWTGCSSSRTRRQSEQGAMALRRDEIIPTYRVPALVRAPGDQVDLRGVEPLTSPVRGVRSTN